MRAWNFIFCLLVGVVMAMTGCGANPSGPTESKQAGLDQQTSLVRLNYVKAASRYQYGSQTAWGRFSGYIELANIAYHKQVDVHYTVRQSGVWQDLEAVFHGPAEGDKEVWYFESPEVAYPARLSADFQFAIRYQVDGVTYWDNNAHQDYKISTGARPIWPSDLVLGKSVIALRKANAYEAQKGYSLEGLITLKNLAYDKIVKVVYTTDGWDSDQEAFASYGHPLSNDSEAWYFSFSLGEDLGRAMTVEFALCYEVDGMRVWDNNFLENYICDVPGSLE